MELINKAKLLAEIERRILEDYNTGDVEMDEVAQGVLASLKYYIEDILEVVKEADLEKDFGLYWGIYADNGGSLNDYEVAKHFFELGLKAQKL